MCLKGRWNFLGENFWELNGPLAHNGFRPSANHILMLFEKEFLFPRKMKRSLYKMWGTESNNPIVIDFFEALNQKYICSILFELDFFLLNLSSQNAITARRRGPWLFSEENEGRDGFYFSSNDQTHVALHSSCWRSVWVVTDNVYGCYYHHLLTINFNIATSIWDQNMNT